MSSLSEQLSSTENKHLLWALMSEENIFTGLGDDAVPLIINIFETAINTASNACSYGPSAGRNRANALAELNKDVIQRVIVDVSKYKASIVSAVKPTQPQNATTAPIYKSADLQEARVRDITSKLKIHEDDMNSFLVLKKPAEINFADDASKDDRPIGDEMEQLIQAALASRARELEILQQPQPQPQPQQQLQQQPQQQANLIIDSQSVSHKKNVSFATEQYITDTTNTIDTIDTIDTTAEMEIGTLFGKLKRSSQQQQQQQQSNKIELSIPSNSNISNNLFNPTQIPTQSDIYQLLVGMKAEFHHLRDSVKLLGEKLDKLDNPRNCSN